MRQSTAQTGLPLNDDDLSPLCCLLPSPSLSQLDYSTTRWHAHYHAQLRNLKTLVGSECITLSFSLSRNGLHGDLFVIERWASSLWRTASSTISYFLMVQVDPPPKISIVDSGAHKERPRTPTCGENSVRKLERGQSFILVPSAAWSHPREKEH